MNQSDTPESPNRHDGQTAAQTPASAANAAQASGTRADSGGAPKGVLGTILLTVFLDLVGFSIIFPLFPDMLEYYLENEATDGIFHSLVRELESLSGLEGADARFAATVLFGGLLGSLFSLLQFVFAPIWGALSDRYGRRPILQITVAGTAFSYLLWIVAEPFWLLVTSRFIGGLMAGNLSVATAAVADVTDSRSRSKGMGMIGAAFGLGFVIGPGMGAALTLWNAAETLPFLPGVNPFSGPAIVAFVLATLNLVLVLRRFPETLQFQTSDSMPTKRPMNPLLLLRPSPFRGVNRTNALYFMFITAFAGMEFTLTFLAKDRFAYTAAQNGLLFLFIGAIIITVQGGIVRRMAPKYGERRLATVGLVMLVPGLLLIGAAHRELWMYVGLFLSAFGSSLVTPCLTALVSLYTPADRQGEMLGIFRSLGSLARVVAPIAAAVAYWRYGSEWPYFGSALMMLIPLLMVFGLPNPKSDAATPPDAAE